MEEEYWCLDTPSRKSIEKKLPHYINKGRKNNDATTTTQRGRKEMGCENLKSGVPRENSTANFFLWGILRERAQGKRGGS